MVIYPNIELHNGQCVNLKHGTIDDPTVFSISPLEAAKKFEHAGAEWLHLVDLDGVFEHDGQNSEIIHQIIAKSNIPVQVGGGIRSQTTVDGWLKAGAERVILGTAAVVDQLFVTDVCTHNPGKILISIDAREGKAVSHGWKHISAFSVFDLAHRFEQCGAAGIIYTDIDRYFELPESSMANTTQMASELECPVISSGAIRDLDDVSMLSQLPNIAGVVIGWALFNERFALEDALKIARSKQTVAEFI